MGVGAALRTAPTGREARPEGWLLNVIRFLDYLADRGAASIHAKGRHGTAALLAEVPGDLEGPILEVGCGTGETSARLCTMGGAVVGADASVRMLASAIGRARWCGVGSSFLPVHAVGAELPFDDRLFSAVVVESVLAIQSPQGVRNLVREIHRVVRPGGRVLVNESVWLSGVPMELALRTNQSALSRLGIVQAVMDPFDADQWVTMFEEENLSLIRQQSLDQVGRQPEANLGFALRTRAYTALKRIRSMASPRALVRARKVKRRLVDIALPYRSVEGVLFVLERRTS